MDDYRRDRVGRFTREDRCDSCGAVIAHHRGAQYATDTDVCDNGDGPGFFLCVDKPKCEQRYQGMDVESRRDLFTRQRAENDAAISERRRSRKV
jgi:hypothetical protein